LKVAPTTFDTPMPTSFLIDPENHTSAQLVKNINSLADIFTNIRAKINDPAFIDRHRSCNKYFSRNRILTFENVILFLLNFIKSSLQPELDKFLAIFPGAHLLQRAVTKAAWSLARRKLKASAFVELNRYFVLLHSRLFPPKRWHGLDLRAIDGSTLHLPKTDDVIAEFGEACQDGQKSAVMARISYVFDPLNKLILDAVIAPYRDDERKMALKLLPVLRPGDLVLLDAGYPAFWLFAALRAAKIDWCARTRVSSDSIFGVFVASGRRQHIVTLEPHRRASADCERLGLSAAPFPVRLVRVDLPDGTVEVLITSLHNVESYPLEDFASLYFLRWGQEESYKFVKHRVEMANWTGRTALSVYQDFHARILGANLTMVMVGAAQESLDAQKIEAHHPKQVNRSFALSAMKDNVVRLITATEAGLQQAMIRQILIVLTKTVEIVRPGRSFPRTKQFRPPIYHQAYKSCL